VTILRKIKRRLCGSFLFRIILKFSLYLDVPWLTALLLSFKSRPVNSSATYTVLCLRKTVFMDDVEAMAVFGEKIRYINFPREDLNYMLKYFIKGDKDREKLTEANYHTGGFCQEGKGKYYSYLKRMIPSLQRMINFDAILAGNLGYLSQQELAKLSEERGIPFIVLHKEGMVVQDRYRDFANMYKNHKFVGAKMLLINRNIQKAMLDVGVRGLSEDKDSVVGIPRLDFYFDVKKGITKQVVFFSFYPPNAFRFFVQDKKMYERLVERSSDFHKLVMDFALRHEDIKVVIKTKFAKHYFQYAKGVFATNFNEPIDNLVITNIGSPRELIQQSMAVLGFLSTTLIEAIIAGRVIVSPYFGDLVLGTSWDYFGEYPELVNYARSVRDLEEFVFNPDKYLQYDSEYKNDFLRERIFEPDGKASLRAEDAIVRAIEEYRDKRAGML